MTAGASLWIFQDSVNELKTKIVGQIISSLIGSLEFIRECEALFVSGDPECYEISSV